MLAGHLALVTGGDCFGCEQAGRGLQVGCGESAGAVNPGWEDVKGTWRTVKAQLPVCSADESGSRDWLCEGLLLELNPEPLVQHSYFLIWWEDKSLTYGLLLIKICSLSDSIPGLSLLLRQKRQLPKAINMFSVIAGCDRWTSVGSTDRT